VQTSLAKVRFRSGRQLIAPDLAAELEQRLEATAADLTALRDGLHCS
jgi:hypothetical protein